jgi:hypothetical protein
MHELLALYRAALRSGDRRLAAALNRVVRADRGLRERADRELQQLERSPPRPTAAGERIVRALLRRLRS